MPYPVKPIGVTNAGGKTISATQSSSSTSFTAGQYKMYVANQGTNTVHIRTGKGSQTAVTTDLAVLAGTAVVIHISPDHDNIGAICASGETATVHCMPVAY